MTLISCKSCSARLPERVNFCPECGAGIASQAGTGAVDGASDGSSPAIAERDPATLHRLGPGGWSFWPPALGLLALVPTAILVSLLALLLPLPVSTVVAALVLAMFQLGLVWVLTTRSWPIHPELYGLRKPRVAQWRSVIAGLLALGASLGSIQLYVMAVTFLGLDFLVPVDLPPDLILPGTLSILSIIALAVITPVAEEIFFRGFVLRGFVNRWGVAPGILLSAIVFAGLHFQPPIIIPVFITGLLLGILYWYTGSIWPGVGVHAGQNLIATVGILVGL